MTNPEMARTYLAAARAILEEAEAHHQRQRWHLVVRRCQEAVELALKAALRAAGIEVPRPHDVAILLQHHVEKFPATFSQHFERLASISRRLRLEHETSFYGDETTGTPPDRLYGSGDADQALADARFTLDRCEEAIGRPVP